MTSPGWLPCEALEWPHDDHEHVYTDPATRLPVTAWCDGTTRPEAEGPCCGGCADPLCPCGFKGSGWVTTDGWTG